MAKLYTYIFITIGLMVLFYTAGLTESEGVVLGEYNMTSTGSLTKIKGSDFFDYLKEHALEALLGTAAGITIGVLMKASPFQILSAGIASGILVKFVADLYTIGTKLSESAGWIGHLGLLILAPLIFGFLIAIWDWVGGKE